MRKGFFRLRVAISAIWIVISVLLLDPRQTLTAAFGDLPSQPTFARGADPFEADASDNFIRSLDKAIQGKVTPSSDWDEWDRVAKEQQFARNSIPGSLVLIFGLPIAALFFGLCIAWIYRGFRPALKL
jgi:hypothetical protein